MLHFFDPLTTKYSNNDLRAEASLYIGQSPGDNEDMENLYLSTAEFYDIDTRHMAYHDVEFYRQYARKMGGNVLEIACGTGRVTIPLAEAGFDVWGIDLSFPMLSILKRKMQSLDSSIARKMHISQADMADFELRRRFDLIIVPFRAFQALTSEERIRSCLGQIRSHLKDDGIFILDVFKPDWRMDESWVSTEEQFDWVKNDEPGGRTIIRTRLRRSIDTVNQIIHPEIVYYIEDASGARERIAEELSLKYYYQYQMEVLLIVSGFTIRESFGYYDKRSTDRGSELIFVCGKTQARGEPRWKS